MEPSDVPSSTGQGLSSQAGLGLTQCKQENGDITASGFVWRPLVLLLLEDMSVSNNSKPISPIHPFCPSHNRHPGSSHHTLPPEPSQQPLIGLPAALLASLLPNFPPQSRLSYPLNMYWDHVIHVLQSPATSHGVWKQTRDVSTWPQGPA